MGKISRFTSSCATASLLASPAIAHAGALRDHAAASSAAKVVPIAVAPADDAAQQCGIMQGVSACSQPRLKCASCALRIARATEAEAAKARPDDAVAPAAQP